MRSRLSVFAALVLAVTAMTGVSAAGAGGRPLSTSLTGANEAPAPGDPNAFGEADITLNQGLGQVCFDISWANVDGVVFAAHIHVGPPGEAGPIVVTLFVGSFAGTDAVDGCAEDVDPALVKAIRQDPSAYYVNVHSQPAFTGGAIRGQLAA